jgi:hypothetical protein
VAEVINRDATGIHSNPFAMKGNEILFLAGQRVVDAKWHIDKMSNTKVQMLKCQNFLNLDFDIHLKFGF